MDPAIKERMTAIFNEWAKRYSEHPEEFAASCLDANGKPLTDYGESCAIYFHKLASELYPRASSRTPK